MKICPYCSAKLADNSNFCINCMHSLTQKIVIPPIKAKKFNKKLIILSSFVTCIALIGAFVLIKMLSAPFADDSSANIASPDDLSVSAEASDENKPISPNSTVSSTSKQETTTPHSPATQGGSETEPPSSGGVVTTPPISNDTDTKQPDTGSSIFPETTDELLVKIKYEANANNTLCLVAGIEPEGSGSTMIIPETYNGMKVVGIKDGAFEGFSSLKKVVIPSTVERIGKNAFRCCFSLEEVVLSEGIEEIADYAFAYCQKLKAITLPSTINTSAKYIFQGCSSLESITSNCAWETEQYRLRELFKDCVSLKTVTVPEGTLVMRGKMFGGCTSLRKVVLPSSLRSLEDGVFEGCTALQEINLEYVGFFCEKPFKDCVSLQKLTIATNSTRAIPEIYPDSFAGCQNLLSVTLPKNIKLYDSSFGQCFSLGTVNYLGTLSDWNSLDFVVNGYEWFHGPSGDCTVYCLDGKITYED